MVSSSTSWARRSRYRLHYLGEALAQADHHARLGGDAGGVSLGAAQEVEGQVVVALGAHGMEDAADGLDVVVEDSGAGIEDGAHRGPVAAEVGRQHLHSRLGRALADALDALGEDGRAAVGQIVAVDGGDDGVAEAEALDGAGEADGFERVEGAGLAGGYGAVAAGAGADVAENHEGGALALPALADVGAARLLADGVEFGLAQQFLHAQVALAAGHAHLEPLGQAADGLGGGVHRAAIVSRRISGARRLALRRRADRLPDAAHGHCLDGRGAGLTRRRAIPGRDDGADKAVAGGLG